MDSRADQLGSSQRDRGFESTSLRRRVKCEPDSLAFARIGSDRVPRGSRFDLGRATVPRITAPHMLPSAVATASAPATSRISWLNPTPQMITVCASPWSSPSPTQHSLPGGRYPLPGPDFHRLDRASFAWRTAEPSAPPSYGGSPHRRLAAPPRAGRSPTIAISALPPAQPGRTQIRRPSTGQRSPPAPSLPRPPARFSRSRRRQCRLPSQSNKPIETSLSPRTSCKSMGDQRAA
jgi:hypothetical protein